MTTKYQKAKHHARNMQLSQRQMRTRMREMEKEISELRAKAEAQAGVCIDAARYRRLQVLGAAPGDSKQLDLGTVLRFQGLDAFIDADMTAHASRGEVLLTSDINPHAPMGVEPVVTRGVGDCSYQLDASISPLVDALNSAGIHTVASCSGHGNRPGNIALKDGRELFIAHDYGEARRIDAMFNVGANGEPAQVVSVPFDIEEYLSAYEWRAEDGWLSELTARDRQLLQDFANGLPLYTAPPAQAVSVPANEFPHDEMDAIALHRFKVEQTDSNVWGWCVRAGDGMQELYKGRKSSCEAVARRLIGAFLDGAMLAHGMLAAAPSPEQPK